MMSFAPLPRRRLSLALGTSVIALAVALPSAAWAQCAPDPTTANGTTTCSGADTDGVRVTTPNTTLIVANNASVSNNGAPAVTVDLPNTNYFAYAAITVNGTVDGGVNSGISALSGSGISGGKTTLVLNVAAGAAVSGSTALSLGQSAGNPLGQAGAYVDNAGTLTGSSGVALSGDVINTSNGNRISYSGFDTILNRAQGVISGSVVGPVGTLTNAGLIDGGNASAFTIGNATSAFNAATASGTWTNSGTIRANSSAATVSGTITNALINSGIITNTGIGAAFSITQAAFSATLTIQNQSGGQISTAGTTAITTNSGVNLVNGGTIIGNVITGDGASMIDSTQGRINGSITLGAGNDTLVVGYDGTATPVTGITGTINAGAGTNTEQVAITTDTTLATPVSLLAGFQQLGIAVAPSTTATLASGFVAPGTITLSGGGTLVNTTALGFGGPAFVDALGNGVVAFTNTGTITASGSAQSAAFELFYTPTIVNTGTIAVVGKGVNAGVNGTILNTGSITATDTAVTAFDNVLTNTGTITSTGGSGVALSGNVGYPASNSGRIVGATIGAVTSIDLANSGTIIATNADGTAVVLNPYGSLINKAGGVVGNGGIAVTASTFNETVINAGTINGSVSLTTAFSGSNQRYISLTGGILNGNLTLGSGDLLLTDLANTGPGAFAGITGTVSAASGAALRYRVSSDGAGTIGVVGPFQTPGYELLNGATLTLTGTATQQLQLAGSGTVNLSGTIATTSTPAILSTSVTNTPGVAFTPTQLAVVSSGTLTLTRASNTYPGAAVALGGNDTFTNDGVITVIDHQAGSSTTAVLSGASVTNRGAIQLDGGIGITGSARVVNTGSITQVAGGATAQGISGVNSIDNRGTIRVSGPAILASGPAQIVNTGTIAGNVVLGFGADTVDNAGALIGTVSLGGGDDRFIQRAGGTLNGLVDGGTGTDAYVLDATGGSATLAASQITNFESVTQSGTGTGVYSGTFAVNTLQLTGGTLAVAAGQMLATVGTTTITAGTTGVTVDTAGTIAGKVTLGAGDDRFIQRAGATLGGLVDAGAGSDRYIVDATGDTVTLAASQIANFESVTQTGTGTGVYSGRFAVDTLQLDGGTLAVAAGQTLATAGVTTITGGDAGVGVVNAGQIAGAVRFGAGNDTYTELAGSSTVGAVDGGAGIDLYRVILAGDRTTIGARTQFEQLAVKGTGTLKLALDQNFQSVALAGTNFTATLGGFTIGRIDGSAAAELVTLDGDVATAALGGGNDALALGATTLAGRYDGGDGIDALRFTATGPVTLTGSAVNFETLSLGNGALTIAGTLGANGGSLAFGDGSQMLTVASGGTLTGAVDLGGGDDSFTLARGGTLAGSVAGGAGTDTATLDFANGYSLKSGTLTDFERLIVQGNGAFTLTGGAFAYGTTNVAGDLTIAADASLATSQLTFGPSDNHLTVAGGFTGSVAGGAGTDSIDIAGGSAATPIAFGTISDVEALRMSAGFATISGNAAFGTLSLIGGRLVGLAGSTITAPTITVGANATFGSAGTVNSNLAVSGTLSPGASPGTMTVNGNVALAGGSTSLFEITPAVSDKLLVKGAVSIAPDATLQLVATQPVTPGKSLELIVASNGITGSFTNVVRSGLFGVLVQDADSISLLGAFLNDTAFSPQVRRSIDYVNSVLMGGRASNAFLTAVPQLVTASGASDRAAFAQLTPEAYASADQITVEQGLELADVGRSAAFGTQRDTPGAFSFGSMLGNVRTLASGAQGTATAQTNSYGFLGGIGWGNGAWSVGGFVGYLNSRQTLSTLGAHTKVDGVVVGLHGRWTDGRTSMKATIAYDEGDATTSRALSGGSAQGKYGRRGWTADLSLDYAIPLSDNWMVRPGIGATAIRTARDGVAETGGSPFALDVARKHDHAVFVDGAATFSGGTQDGAVLRPYLSVGVRYQADGRTPDALAALGGGGYGLSAAGAQRAPVVATAAIGTDIAVSGRLTVFGALSGESGDADHRASAHAGVRLRF